MISTAISAVLFRALLTKITEVRTMADLFDNPMGLDGFEFVEYAATERGILEPVFETLGFTHVARHRSKDVDLWRQGDINFIINYETNSPAYYYCEEHGPSACGMAFRVRDAKQAYQRALDQGAQPIDIPVGPMELKLPAIRGIGGAILYLIDRYEDGASIYDIDFEYLEGVDRHPKGCGFELIDHLTHNVYRGRMDYWANYYEKLFNFREIRYFDIKGEYTGLRSRAMTAPDGKIRIPLNEEGGAGGGGQIEEYLLEYNGEGIQHIAFSCDDLPACLDRLKALGMKFMTPPPNTYYDMLEERLPGHGESVEELKSRGILLDGSTDKGEPRLLLQIFSETMVGPIFFEFIQRKQDEGFGEGNFQALFESIERDQVARGTINSESAA
jgi:4-hydroxyphenylpyruvate dioxygenase